MISFRKHSSSGDAAHARSGEETVFPEILSQKKKYSLLVKNP